MDCRIELIFVPVSDVDRARDFYVDTIGFTLDHDVRVSETLRFVQVTPVGSACSIAFGEGLGEQMVIGTQKGIQVVVDSAQAAYDELVSRGVEATPVEELAWGIFTGFSDPDGNSWAIQELPQRG